MPLFSAIQHCKHLELPLVGGISVVFVKRLIFMGFLGKGEEITYHK
jgi:hypothetical protein